MPKVTGRPRKELDFREFENYCFLQCTLEQIAEFFAVSPDTVERRVEEHYGESFAEVFAQKRQAGVMFLRSELFRRARTSDACLIFSLKTLAGFKETQVMEHTHRLAGQIPPSEFRTDELERIAAGERPEDVLAERKN